MAEQVHQAAAELVIDQNTNRIEGSSLLFALSAILVVAFCLFLVVYNFSLKRSISDYNTQKESIISQIQTPDNQKLEKTINSTAVTIANLKSILNSEGFQNSDLLANFPKIIPKNTMLNNLSVDQDSNLKIDGQTESMSSLATLIQSLHDSGYLDKVTLAGVVTETSNNKLVTKFSISCILNKDKARAVLSANATASNSPATSDSTVDSASDSSVNNTPDTSTTTSESASVPTENITPSF